MRSLEQYLDDSLVHGRRYFSREEAHEALSIAPRNLAAAATRMIKKGRLAKLATASFPFLDPKTRLWERPILYVGSIRS
jgi:predicted transcriptional regulator of viral defense system